MQFRIQFVTGISLAAALAVFAGQSARAQNLSAPARGVTAPSPGARLAKGMPPRANAGEYLSHVQAGAFSIGAEFDRHSVPTPEEPLTTEDFIAVEVGIFGAPNAHLTISSSDFSLRVNGKKTPLPVEQFAAVFKSLRDPTWFPPEAEEAKASKAGNVGLGGGDTQNDLGNTPAPVKIPPEMERSMAEHVQNAALPEGNRELPVAGLIFFRYTGLAKGIHSVQLLYNGAAGKATIALQP